MFHVLASATDSEGITRSHNLLIKLFTCQGCQPNCWREHHSMSAQSCWEDVRKVQVVNRALLELFVGINFTRKRLQQPLALLSNKSPFCWRIWGCYFSPHSDENTQNGALRLCASPCIPEEGLILPAGKINVCLKWVCLLSASLGAWKSLLGTSLLPLTTGTAEEEGNICFGWGDLDFHTAKGGHVFPHCWPPLVHA